MVPVLLVALEPEDESPIVFLRLRKAARGGTRVHAVGAVATNGLAKMSGSLVPARPGDEAQALLEQVGLQAQAERTCAELAYGDLKRVELAIALANEPKLLLMDEPTAGMAPKERVALMELAARLARARQIAVLFTEHDMDVVFAQASRIIVLNRGKLIAQGTPAQVRADRNVQDVYLGSGSTFGGH